MRKLTLRLVVALITFAIGVAATVIWMMGYLPKDKKPGQSKRSEPSSCFPGLAKEIKEIRSTKEGYFPEGLFSDNHKSSEFIDSGYSNYLRGMNEPSFLSPGDGNSSRFRFLWLRSFHPPVAVTISEAGGKYTLTVKQLDRADSSQPTEPVVNKTRLLSEDEWATFIQLVNNACFWEMPSRNPEPSSEDGAWWVLEGVHGGRYHIVDRQSPENGPYREACLYLLKIGVVVPFSFSHQYSVKCDSLISRPDNLAR